MRARSLPAGGAALSGVGSGGGDASSARARRLARHYLFSGPATARLTSTLELAASALGFPYAQVNVLDDVYQYTISDHGVQSPPAIPRDESLCQFTVDGEQVLAVDDLSRDGRFVALPSVAVGLAASYLGAPVRSREAETVGTLCVLDDRVHPIGDREIALIAKYAAIVEDQLEVLRRDRERHGEAGLAVADVGPAIARGDITPWYQSVHDLRTGAVVSYEALARWNRDGRMVNPASFLPPIEDGDLIIDLDRAVMFQALADAAGWRRLDPVLGVNVNLSTRHLEIDGGVEELQRLVDRSGVPPEAISLELTETRPLTDVALARRSVAQLRRAGFPVVLDDFGVGWSSLEWVLELPVSGVKLDRALTAALARPTGVAIVRAVAEFTADLGLDTVVEGVANREQVDLLAGLGFHQGQGYLWSPPQPPGAITVGDS